MKLIGMLDSPYVRRVAISLDMMGVAFTHESLSVFRHYDTFRSINPVVKAPTLVTDQGVPLMDSTLILDYAERLVDADRQLMPPDSAAHLLCLHTLGLALAACEKTVQIVYETTQRPVDKQHTPWLDRVTGQLAEAYDALEALYAAAAGPWLCGDHITQADITTAVAWYFTHLVTPGIIEKSAFPALTRLSERAEALPSFRNWPAV